MIEDYSKHPQYDRKHHPFIDEKDQISRFGESIRTAARQRFIQQSNYRCNLCHCFREPTQLELDHIVPLCRGGTNDDSNLQVLCVQCHESKTIYDLGRIDRPFIGADGFPIEVPATLNNDE